MFRRCGFVAFVIACGGSGSVAATPSGTLPDASVAVATPAVHERIASDAMLAAWPLATPEMLFYADVAGALKNESLVAKLTAAIPSFVSPSTPAAQLMCIRDAILAASEVVFGADRGTIMIAHVDRAHAPQFRACFGAATSTETVRGADDAWAFDHDVVATSRDLLLFGKRELVETAIERQGKGAAALRSFALAGDQLARLHLESGITIDGTLSLTPAKIFAGVEIETRTPHDADKLAEEVSTMAAQIPPTKDSAEHDALARLAGALHATHEHKHVKVVFSLDEPVADQLRDLSAALWFAKRGVDDYLIASKQAEARATINAIAKDIVMDWEREPMPGTPKPKKRLTSFPAVPSSIPRGVAVTTKPDDWKPWAPLRFQMDAPQRYQYEVRAAADGLSASVFARGDLNGDGKPSAFEIPITVDHAKHLVIGEMRITSPNE